MILEAHTSLLLFHVVFTGGAHLYLYSICLNMFLRPVWLSVLNDENNDEKLVMAVIVLES